MGSVMIPTGTQASGFDERMRLLGTLPSIASITERWNRAYLAASMVAAHMMQFGGSTTRQQRQLNYAQAIRGAEFYTIGAYSLRLLCSTRREFRESQLL